LTEEQQSGTAPEPGAVATADQAPDATVATATTDEPATTADAATSQPASSDPDPGASAPAEPAEAPAAPVESTALAEEPVTSATLSPAETADAPAATDEEPAPAPARDLGPEPTTMEELLAEQDSDIKSFKHGDVVEGQVVRIDKDEILVDIGAKSEGVVSNRELFGRHGEGQPALNVGDTVLVYVLQPASPEGHVVLSLRRAGLERKWRAMQEQFEAGVIIEAPVIDHNKGGLIVDCGIRGFVPISQIVDFPRRPQNDQPRDAAQEIAEKLQPFVGRKLRLKILEVNRKANRLILSEKVALYEERREKRDELFSSLQVGQRVKGTVRSIAPFGVFIDLGGIDGLVHKSELSWNKVNNPEAGYRVGEEVEAEVIDINHERGRISLSIRRLQPDPWHSTVADFNVGDVIDGTVTKLVNFGAFVRVRDGLEGLIHISELSHQRVAHPGDVVHEGQQLKLKIISLDSERHRLGLSLKQAEEPPARPAPEPMAHAPSAPSGQRQERRPRPDRGYSMSDAVQEPEGGIDNTLASAFAQVREQLAAAEGGERAEVEEPAEAPAPEGSVAEAAESEAAVVEAPAAEEPAEAAAQAEAPSAEAASESAEATSQVEAPAAEAAPEPEPETVAEAAAEVEAPAAEAAPEPETVAEAAPEAESVPESGPDAGAGVAAETDAAAQAEAPTDEEVAAQAEATETAEAADEAAPTAVGAAEEDQASAGDDTAAAEPEDEAKS
jgi:small subunit ribosomal protein S1